MRLTILNGNPDPADVGFDRYLEAFSRALNRHEVEELRLRDLRIKPCSGCFGCWVKTPGVCLRRDEDEILGRAILNADLTIFASPVVMGFTSSLLRRATEKILPLFLPYFKVVDGEIRHPARYSRTTEYALLLQREQDTDEEDLEIITDIYKEIAREGQTDLRFVRLTDVPPEEVADEVNSL